MDEEGNGEVIWEHRGNRAAGEGGREWARGREIERERGFDSMMMIVIA